MTHRIRGAPFHQKAECKGREHHSKVFSSSLAGAGVTSGITFGVSDEFGIDVAKDMLHFHDFHFHATIRLLRIDHACLTYRYAGHDFRLTDVSGPGS